MMFLFYSYCLTSACFTVIVWVSVPRFCIILDDTCKPFSEIMVFILFMSELQFSDA